MKHFWQEISDAKYSENERIQVYQTNFQAAKLKALDENFSITKSLIGSTYFQAIAKHFIQNIGSTDDSLNLYGKEFPSFLNEIIPYNSNLLGKNYLSDIANLDWAVMQSYFAEDDDPMINWTLTGSGENAFLTVAKHAQYVNFEHFSESPTRRSSKHALTCFSTEEFKDFLSDLFKYSQQFDQTQALLVFRQDFEVKISLLSIQEATLFLLLRERTPLFLLEEKLAKIASSEEISHMIQSFKESGMLIGISEPNCD